MADQKTMEPKPIPASFVATHYLGLHRQAKATLCPAYLLQDRLAITGRDLPLPGPLRCTRGEAKLPFVHAQLEREKQGWGEGGLLIDAGRCCCCHRRAPSVERMLKELNTSGLVCSSSPT